MRRIPCALTTEAGTGGLKPYVLVRARLEALVSRALFYDLVAAGTVKDGWFGVWSSGAVLSDAAGRRDRTGSRELPLRRGRIPRARRDGCIGAPPEHARRSDDDLNPEARIIPAGRGAAARRRAGAAGAARRRADVLLTQRTAHLSSHAGQVAFPGGRIDDGRRKPGCRGAARDGGGDGHRPGFVEPLGFLDTYLTGTAYRVVPVVAHGAAGVHGDAACGRSGGCVRGAACLSDEPGES